MVAIEENSQWHRDEFPALRSALLAHYQHHKRDLPWRRTTDPYAIWISEIMLQQTQVISVIPRYAEFLSRFPTVKDLAAATEAEVCEAWAGLGYYRRARNLRRGAVEVLERFGGTLPNTLKDLISLPGIGRYTAGAIASIAFGVQAPLVDGNVTRVFARLFALKGARESPELKKRAWAIATSLVVGHQPGDFNQALMELGALICKPSHPICHLCPVESHCIAARSGEVMRYPARSDKPSKQRLAIAFAWHENRRGVWLEQRTLDGLWAGLWELPSGEGSTISKARTALAERVAGSLGPIVCTLKHVLTHREVTATVYCADKKPKRIGIKAARYVAPLEAPLSTLARKAIVQAQRTLS